MENQGLYGVKGITGSQSILHDVKADEMLMRPRHLIVKTVEITVCTGLKNRSGHYGSPALVSS